MRRYLLWLGAIFFVCLPSIAQGKEWRGIVPLKSTRADVERLLGLPGQHGRYQFENERAYIDYAGAGQCDPANGCLCFLSKDTVMSIYVELEVEMRFSKLNIDRKKYKKFISPQDPTIATYSNDREGIIYTVDETNDDVSAIEYLPTAKDCQDVLKRAKRAKSLRKTRCVAADAPSSSLALFVLHNKGGDNLNDLFLLPARKLRDFFKNLVHLAGWSSFAAAFDVHFFTQQLGNSHTQDACGLADELH